MSCRDVACGSRGAEARGRGTAREIKYHQAVGGWPLDLGGDGTCSTGCGEEVKQPAPARLSLSALAGGLTCHLVLRGSWEAGGGGRAGEGGRLNAGRTVHGGGQ